MVLASHQFVDLLEPAATGELQEYRGQVIVAVAREATDLVHSPLRDNLPLLDDADPMAHLLGHFDRKISEEPLK